jgi:nucleoid-associated protein YgaU
MKLTPWLILISLSLAACSGSKSAQKVNEEMPQIELSDADEFIDSNESLADGSLDGYEQDTAFENTETQNTESEIAMNTEPLVQDSYIENNMAPQVSYEASEMRQYTVEKNETLMMISFKLYGDYAKWKELASQNREKLKGGTTVMPGMVLDYAAPAETFVFNPQGSPYLIRTGDTLGGISTTVYNTSRKWKLLWENNRPLIKDPNKIYAGFTIYYPESGRDVANEF